MVYALRHRQGQVQQVEDHNRRGPTPVTSAYQAARIDLGSRALIVDLRSLTAISAEGQAILVHLMHENVKFICGVYMREVLRQIALKPRGSTGRSASDSTESA